MLLSVIVPCYNEEENVECFYDELLKLESFFSQNTGYSLRNRVYLIMYVYRTYTLTKERIPYAVFT